MSHQKLFLLLVGSTMLLMITGFLLGIGLSLGFLVVDYWLSQPEAATQKLVIKTIRDYATVVPTVTALPDDSLAFASTAPPVGNEIVFSDAGEGSAEDRPTPILVSADAAGLLASITNTPSTAPALTGSTLTSPLPTPTATQNSQTPTPTPTPTGTASPTATVLSPATITGRLVLDGSAMTAGAVLKLENSGHQSIAETNVGTDGSFSFTNLPASSQGYTVVFAQEWNPAYESDEVISWGWLGRIPVSAGETVTLPDFEIALQGFGQVNPEPNTTFSAAAVSSSNPIQFEWNVYPGASKYWVDLTRGDEQQILWQSPLVQSSSFNFDGKMNNGSQLESGEYWWGVGARRNLGSYGLAVYGYLPVLLIEP